MRKLIANLAAALVPFRSIRHKIRNSINPKAVQTGSSCVCTTDSRRNLEDDFIYNGGIADWGESFKRYFLRNNMPEKIRRLRNGLDDNEQAEIDVWLERMLFLPDSSDSDNYRIHRSFIDSFDTQQDRNIRNAMLNEAGAYTTEYALPEGAGYNEDTFVFHHGLRYAPGKVKKYVAGKAFIDGGAYVGDSALVLARNYNPCRVWSFEILSDNIEKYHWTMKNNHIPDDKYRVLQMGLSESNGEINFADSSYDQVGSLLRNGKDIIKCVSVDSFADSMNLDVGFIKTDLEGSGLDALCGMQKTIEKSRPVVALAIYHNPTEFFEMKPLFESYTKNLDYKISIQKMDSHIYFLAEIVLFAYPRELE